MIVGRAELDVRHARFGLFNPVPVHPVSRYHHVITLAAAAALSACGDAKMSEPPVTPVVTGPPTTLTVLGAGRVAAQFTSEVHGRGSYVYTTTWGARATRVGNTVRTWDITSNTPVAVDSQDIAGATTTGDVQVSDDGRLLIVATERLGGSLVIYSLANPAKPQLLATYHTANTDPGVHTAEVARVNGTLYGFLSIDPAGGTPAKLVIVDLSDPANPREVLARTMGQPYVHDVFVRDGLLFTALWDAGLTIWDIGGGGRGGTPANPIQLGNVRTAGGQVHNVWWLNDPVSGSKRFAFVGQEGPGSIGSSASGDIHVVDVSDLTQPREVAFFSVAGAGTHNFDVDEQRGILYAAYYNGGVRALNVRGDLGTCTTVQKAADGRCDLGLMGRERARGLTDQGAYVWGVKLLGGALYASDMLNGLWKLAALTQ